jgi:HTH-type transcriptional regulator / antitoxin HigA
MGIGGFNPDYGVAPGCILHDFIDAKGWTQAEFALRCGRTPKMISEILNAKAPILPETAMIFEKVLGVPAKTWLNLESHYQLYRSKEKEKSLSQHYDIDR